jgi:hypothetical protein
MIAVEVISVNWHTEDFATMIAVAAQFCVWVAFPARRVHHVIVLFAPW